MPGKHCGECADGRLLSWPSGNRQSSFRCNYIIQFLIVGRVGRFYPQRRSKTSVSVGEVPEISTSLPWDSLLNEDLPVFGLSLRVTGIVGSDDCHLRLTLAPPLAYGDGP